MRITRILKLLLIFVFIIILYFPFLNYKFNLTGTGKSEFLKTPIPLPQVNWLSAYPNVFESYFNRNFELKPCLVSANSYLRAKFLNTSSNPDRVLMGKDNWLFMGGDFLYDYCGIKIYSNEDLMKIKNEIRRRAAYAKNKYGSKFYLVPIPNKQSIYPEQMPLFAAKVRQYTKTDQILSLFKNESWVTVIDVRPDLLNKKKDHLLYYKTDNHWNEYGAYIAYKKIIGEINKDFPTVIPEKIENYVLDSSKVLVGGEAQLLNAGEIFHESRFTYKSLNQPRARIGKKFGYPAPLDFEYAFDFEHVTETKDSLLPDAIIFRDSFTDFNMRFFVENFNKANFIFDAWKYKSNFNMVDDIKPKIVLYMIVESNLDRLLDKQ